MIWRYRGRWEEPGVRMQIGFLYEGYNIQPAGTRTGTHFWLGLCVLLAYQKQVPWFEMLDMLHKLTLSSLLAFAADAAQVQASADAAAGPVRSESVSHSILVVIGGADGGGRCRWVWAWCACI